LVVPDVCVVVPTYNEAGTVRDLVSSLEDLREILKVRIVFVDDGSTDGTLEVIRGQMRRFGNITLVVRGERLGLGSAIIECFEAALSLAPAPDFIVTMDGDLSHDPAEIPRLVGSCGEGTLIIGSRYIDGGRIVGWRLRRRIASRAANLLARALGGVPVRDCTSGFRCYHADVIRGILGGVGCDGYDIQIDALMEALRGGFGVGEIPITFRDRRSGESKLTAVDAWKFVRRVVSR
jgi:dolichol-phosphate mannosyltransferase